MLCAFHDKKLKKLGLSKELIFKKKTQKEKKKKEIELLQDPELLLCKIHC